MKLGLFGIGRSNLGVYEYLSRRMSIDELTLRSDTAIPDEIVATLQPNRVFVGERALFDVYEDALFLSPSARRDRPELKAAAERGVTLTSDLELYLEKRGGIDVAVTGSDGKSTTTYLLADALTRSGKRAMAVGNFGVPLSSVIDEDAMTVAELSSFQLMYASPKARTAVITNIVPNHLNWHKDLDEYVGAKLNILSSAERTVINADDKISSEVLSGHPVFAAVSTALPYGELRLHLSAEHYLTYRCGTVYLDGVPYLDVSEAKRREAYNVKNYMLTAAALIGECGPEAIRAAVLDFCGLPHRAELVGELDGKVYLDSSVDSTPERTLNTLRGIRGDIAVIIAGRGKRLSLYPLAEELPRLTVGCVLMGEIGEELCPILSRTNADYPFIKVKDMASAVRAASELISGSGTVVLSPAGTSFDSYKNFEERGRDFRRAAERFINENKGL